MDKTLEIVIAAAVLMMIAAVLFFMITDQSDIFSSSTNSQIDKSECRLLESEWKLASSTSEKEEIESEASGCEWVSDAPSGGCMPTSGGNTC